MCLYNERPLTVVRASNPVYGWRRFDYSKGKLQPVVMGHNPWREDRLIFESNVRPTEANESGLYAYVSMPEWMNHTNSGIVARVVAWGRVIRGTIYPGGWQELNGFRAEYMAIETLYTSRVHAQWLARNYTQFPIIVV